MKASHPNELENAMKAMHWGLLLLIVIAYFVGVKYPSAGTAVLGKVGLS